MDTPAHNDIALSRRENRQGAVAAPRSSTPLNDAARSPPTLTPCVRKIVRSACGLTDSGTVCQQSETRPKVMPGNPGPEQAE